MLLQILFIIVTICYGAIGVTYLVQGNPAMSLVFVGYSVANIALYFAGQLH